MSTAINCYKPYSSLDEQQWLERRPQRLFGKLEALDELAVTLF